MRVMLGSRAARQTGFHTSWRCRIVNRTARSEVATVINNQPQLAAAQRLFAVYPHLRAREGHGAVQHFGDAQVAQHQPPVAQQEDVLRLDVPVQHLVLVHVVDGQRDLHEPVQDLVLLDEGSLACCQPGSEVAAVAKRHHDAQVVLSIGKERVAVCHDIWVLQPLH